MSRGHGRIQRGILSALSATYDPYGRPELWLCVSTLNLGLEVHRESKRRAAHQLARQGLIEVRSAPATVAAKSDYFEASRLRRKLVFARFPLGAEHCQHVVELRREYEAFQDVLNDPEAEQRDRTDALRWIDWYEQPERWLRWLSVGHGGDGPE